MARCIDWPCCGHENGCCPDYDESGRQLNMVCTCGAKLPINNRYSICDACLRMGDEYDGRYDDSHDDDCNCEDCYEDCDDCDGYEREDFGDWGYDSMIEE